jgi:hypothetical protein
LALGFPQIEGAVISFQLSEKQSKIKITLLLLQSENGWLNFASVGVKNK